MRVPVIVKILGLTVGATAFYTWVGQLVPQKEVQPPQVVEMAQDMGTDEMVKIGQEIFNGKGLCSTCHTIGRSGALRFPDLDGAATRAADRVPGLDQLQYFAQSLYEPSAYIVPGFNPGMPEISKPPIGLSDDEIKAVIAYLQTLGGEATITMATRLPYAQGAEAEMAGTAAGPPIEPVASGAAPAAGGGDLLSRFGCAECHGTEPGGERTLAGLGKSARELAADLAGHRPPLDGTPAARMTLEDIHALASYLAGLEGGE
jgi:mono/diheme cytochrome c family protein